MATCNNIISQKTHLYYSRILRWSWRTMSSFPYLLCQCRGWASQIHFSLSQRNNLQPGIFHLWLVVQCRLWWSCSSRWIKKCRDRRRTRGSRCKIGWRKSSRRWVCSIDTYGAGAEEEAPVSSYGAALDEAASESLPSYAEQPSYQGRRRRF